MSDVVNALLNPRELKVRANEDRKPTVRVVGYERTNQLAIKTAAVCAFYMAACIYYANAEGWSAQDCIYFLTVTISTVGYGDYHPSTDGARMFTISVIIVSVVFIFSIRNDFINTLLKLAEEPTSRFINQQLILGDPYKYWRKRAPPLLMMLALLFVCSITLWLLEDWTYIQALYFSLVTITTIGYGDLTVKHSVSKIFITFFIPLSVCVVAAALRRIALINIEVQTDRRKLESHQQRLNFSRNRKIRDKDGDGVDKLEFLIAMLVQNNICNQEDDIDPWLKRFDELDKDGSGRLCREAIGVLEREEKERIALLQEAQFASGRQGYWIPFVRNRFYPGRIKHV